MVLQIALNQRVKEFIPIRIASFSLGTISVKKDRIGEIEPARKPVKPAISPATWYHKMLIPVNSIITKHNISKRKPEHGRIMNGFLPNRSLIGP